MAMATARLLRPTGKVSSERVSQGPQGELVVARLTRRGAAMNRISVSAGGSTTAPSSSPRRVLVCYGQLCSIAEPSANSVALARLADYSRFRGDADGAGCLETSITAYEGITRSGRLFNVDLVAAIHVADAAYFEALQRELSGYDRVLYECVADTSKHNLESGRWRPPIRRPFSRGKGLISAVQKTLSQILGLQFQLDSMDYRGDTWFHGDVTLAQFKTLMQTRKETMFTLPLNLAVASWRSLWLACSAGGPSRWRTTTRQALLVVPMPLLVQAAAWGMLQLTGEGMADGPRPAWARAFLALDVSTGLKLVLAQALCGDVVADTWVGGAEAGQSAILGGRNEAAIAALKSWIEDVDASCPLAIVGRERQEPQAHPSAAIFFGSAHHPDLARRLEEMGLTRTDTPPRWFTAWRLDAVTPFAASPPGPLQSAVASLSAIDLPGGITGTHAVALLFLSTVLASDLVCWEWLARGLLDAVSRASDLLSR